jgi:hypothetical protein
MTVLAFRSGRLLASFLIVAVVAAACSPAATPPGPASQPPTSAASTAMPVAVAGATQTPSAAPSGDAVTGGEATAAAEPTAMVEPTAAPTPTSEPEPTPTPRPAAQDDTDPFAMNLYRKGDFVAQYTFEWCVGASLQMARNMTTDGHDTGRSSQQSLWAMAQARSSSPFGGANPLGWTAALNDLGIGPYRLVSIADYDEALRVAATAMRDTKRPVGLVMWRGRHAWVMSGFASIGDPAATSDITVTGVRVLDPLYPHGSKVWGPSPKPNALVTPATLAKQFVVRDHGRANLGVPPGYLLILPTNDPIEAKAD